MTKLASVLPFATGISTNGVPAVVVLGDTSSTFGLLLVIRTVTPPCAVAPSRAAKPPVIRPPPTSPGRFSSVMPGALTVTVTGGAAWKPPAVAVTVVEPPPIGSKATPPAATVVGEFDCPAAIVTVRD